MKIKDFITLFENLKTVQSKNYSGTKFAYVLSKNIGLMKPEIQAIQDSFPKNDDEKYKEYEEKRLETVRKYAKKDENDEFIIENNSYVLAENEEEFNKEFDSIKKDFSDFLDSVAENKKIIENILEEEAESIELRKIKIEDLPENLSTLDFAGISEIIEE